MATGFFVPNGTAQPTDPLDYNFVAVAPFCPGGSNLCSIFASQQIIDGVTRPVITSTLSAEITAALNTNTPSANVKLKL